MSATYEERLDELLALAAHSGRATEHYVESRCGMWRITPVYGGLTRPERYELRLNWNVVGSGQTQAECKNVALCLISPSARRTADQGKG